MTSYGAEQTRLQRFMDETDIYSNDKYFSENHDEFEIREGDSESEQDLSDGIMFIGQGS